MVWKHAAPCLVDELLYVLQRCCREGMTPAVVHSKKKPYAITTSEPVSYTHLRAHETRRHL
eukprot:4114627-Prorocentrum_lima.AAC.1